MEIHELAATIAHEICNPECFAFTGDGPKPHSRQCQAAAHLIASAMRKFGDPMQAQIERLRALLLDADTVFQIYEREATGRLLNAMADIPLRIRAELAYQQTQERSK